MQEAVLSLAAVVAGVAICLQLCRMRTESKRRLGYWPQPFYVLKFKEQKPFKRKETM